MIKNYQNNLSAIRGLSFLMVVIFHYTYQFSRVIIDSPIDSYFLKFCGYGVYLFFILSGRLIGSKLYSEHSASRFLTSRLIRIYPTYLFCASFSFLLFKIIAEYNRELTSIDLFYNLSFLVFFTETPRIDGVYWSLYLEVLFYMYVALLIKVKKYTKYILIVCGIIVLANSDSIVAKLITLNGTLPFFILGIIENKIPKIQKVLLFSIALLLILIDPKVLYHEYAILYFIYLTLSRSKLSSSVTNFLSQIGRISYTGYLIHQGVFFALFMKLERMNSGFVESYTGALVLTLLSILLIYTFIEKKATAYLYGLVK